MVKKIKRSKLTDVFILSWVTTSDKLKIVCKKNFKFEFDTSLSFIEGEAYILERQGGKPNEFYVINSNKNIHWIYKYGKKNRFFHKYFEIAKISKK